MSQSNNSSRGDLSPSAPRDADYPPQHHAGAVGLGPEFGKGAVCTNYSLSRKTLADTRSSRAAHQRQAQWLEAGNQRKDDARSKSCRTRPGPAHRRIKVEGDERGKHPASFVERLSRLKRFL